MATFIFPINRVVSLSFCSRNESFISGSLDRTVLLWDQRVEKCQVHILAYVVSISISMLIFNIIYDPSFLTRVFYVHKEGLLRHLMTRA